jgi:hypothetical protein
MVDLQDDAEDDTAVNKELPEAGSVTQTDNNIEDIQSRPLCVKTLCEYEGVSISDFYLVFPNLWTSLLF